MVSERSRRRWRWGTRAIAVVLAATLAAWVLSPWIEGGCAAHFTGSSWTTARVRGGAFEIEWTVCNGRLVWDWPRCYWDWVPAARRDWRWLPSFEAVGLLGSVQRTIGVPGWMVAALIALVLRRAWGRAQRPVPGVCRCGYNLSGLPGGVCPECGEATE